MKTGSDASGQTTADLLPVFKVCCVGAPKSGKSTSLQAAKDGKIQAEKSTIDIDFMELDFASSGKNVRVLAWDIASEERYGIYYRHSEAIIIYLDSRSPLAVNKSSFEHWSNDANRKCSKARLFVLLTHADAVEKNSSLADIKGLIPEDSGITLLGECNATDQRQCLAAFQRVTDTIMAREALVTLAEQIKRLSLQYLKSRGQSQSGHRFAFDTHTETEIDEVELRQLFLLLSLYLSDPLGEKPDAFFHECQQLYQPFYIALSREYPQLLQADIQQGNFPTAPGICRLLGVQPPAEPASVIRALMKALLRCLYSSSLDFDNSRARILAICNLYEIPEFATSVELQKSFFWTENKIRTALVALGSTKKIQEHLLQLQATTSICEGRIGAEFQKAVQVILPEANLQAKTSAELLNAIEKLSRDLPLLSNDTTQQLSADLQLALVNPAQRNFQLLSAYFSNPCGEQPDKFFLTARPIFLYLQKKFAEEFPAMIEGFKAQGNFQDEWELIEDKPSTLEEMELAPYATLLSKALLSCLYRNAPKSAEAICKHYGLRMANGIDIRCSLFSVEADLQKRHMGLKTLSSLQFHIESLLQNEDISADSTLKKALRNLLEDCRKSVMHAAEVRVVQALDSEFTLSCLGAKGVGKTTFRRGITPSISHDNEKTVVKLDASPLSLVETGSLEADGYVIILDCGKSLEENEAEFNHYAAAIQRRANHGPLFVVLSSKHGSSSQLADLQHLLKTAALIGEFTIPQVPHFNVAVEPFVKKIVAHLQGMQRWNQFIHLMPDGVVAQIQLQANAYLLWSQGLLNFPTEASKTLAEDIQNVLRQNLDEREVAKKIFHLMSYYFCHLDEKPDQFARYLYPLYLKLLMNLIYHVPDVISESLQEGNFPMQDNLCAIWPCEGIFVLDEEPYQLDNPTEARILLHYTRDRSETLLRMFQKQYGQHINLQREAIDQSQVVRLIMDCLLKHSRKCDFPVSRPNDKAVQASRDIITQIAATFPGKIDVLPANFTGLWLREKLTRWEKSILMACRELDQASKFTLQIFNSIADPALQTALEKMFANMPVRMAPLPEYGSGGGE